MKRLFNSAVCLLDKAAVQYPDNIALEDENGQLTYSQYRNNARALGTALIKNGGAKPVIVFMPKNKEALICFMGTMYSGAPYVPAAMNIPAARLGKIIAGLAPCYLITIPELLPQLENCNTNGAEIMIYDELIKEPSDDNIIENVLTRIVDTDPIYIMFTSGSTGEPKGVTIPHRGILDYADWVSDTFGFNEDTVMANQAPFYFDNSTFDIYSSIRCGAKLILTPESLFLFPSKLPEFLKENNVTSIFWVPTVMINVANSGVLDKIELPKLKNAAFCGEVMPNKQLNIWRRALPECSFANLYGPTEITDVCCYYKVTGNFQDSNPLPIGRACENMRILILTKDGREAQPNEPGELCVIGTGVALGYWNAPEITERVFVRNPLNNKFNERMYRTGDLAYYTDDGIIMFTGRSDNQIKLKGNRIELGEIETAAMCISGVENACAVFDEEKQRIVLFIESQEKPVLRRFNLEMKKYIPQYMLPSKIVAMPSLPHTANDKIDRVKLHKKLSEV